MTTADVTRGVALHDVEELRRRRRLLVADDHLRLPSSDPRVAPAVRPAHAPVVVPSRSEVKPNGRVVVGLREAHHSADALAVGFAEADRRGAALLVNLIRDAGAADKLDPIFHTPDESDVEEAGYLPVAVAAAGRPFPDVRVTSVVRAGPFAEVLVELSHSAELVVLGMGERPAGMGRKDLLIASHSTCPVIVVRESLNRGGI